MSTSTGPPLTPEQRDALGPSATSVAVTAGAGCGKTTVLTERFLRCLDGPDRRPLGQLVALTYTDKAARELRERVRKACRQQLDMAGPGSPWRLVLRGLEAAPIGTFHSFCGRLLRRFGAEAGVEPGFAILEEVVAPSLREDTIAASARGWLSRGDEDFFTLAVELGVENARDLVATLVAGGARDQLSAVAGETPDQTVARWEAAWRELVQPALARRAQTAAQASLELLAAHPCKAPIMARRREFLIEHLPGLATHDDLLGEVVALNEQAKIQGVTAKHWEGPEVHAEVRDALEAFRDVLTKIKKSLSFDETANREAAERAGRFARLALQGIDAYDAAKRDRGVLDFNDLLIRARDLLRGPPEPVRAWAQQAIGFVMVDEFQDTDPVQSELLDLLTGGDWAGGRLFLVGDTKQSIYRFRGARPDIFERHWEELPGPARRKLTANFRGIPPILDFVNALFGEAFPGEHNRLVPGKAVEGMPAGPAITFLWANEAPTEPDDKGGVGRQRIAEARWIARYLKRGLADQDWPVRDKDTSQWRPAAAGDVVLLFRSLNDAAHYESALAAEGLDYHIVGGKAFYAQQEVLDLINVLATLDDPDDPLALAATLRGPFGAVSDEGLFWLSQATGGDLVAAFSSGAEVPGLSERDRTQVTRLRALMRRWGARKDRASIAALVDQVLDESGYEAAVVAEFLGDRKRANLRKLVGIARRFDAQGEYTLADFVARLRADWLNPPKEEQAATTDEHGLAVRLMTIHQAKGLEFPIVVVPDLNRNTPPRPRVLGLHPALGLVAKAPALGPGDDEDGTGGKDRPSLGWLAYRTLEDQEETNEALRLFYVATTRARDALILSAGGPVDERPRNPAMRLLDERFDRATGACRAALPPGDGAPSARVIVDEPAAVSAGPRPPRPRPVQVARRIRRGAPEPVAPSPMAAARPALFDLDSAPGLGPRRERTDRLMRAVLADPRGLDPATLAAVVEQSSRAGAALAPPSIQADVRRRLGEWLEGPLARELSRAKCPRRFVPWAVPWPADDPWPTVFRGAIDLLFQEGGGRPLLVQVALAEANEDRERLRLVLAARAAMELGLGTVSRAWLVRLGEGGGLAAHDRFDDAEIDRLARVVLAGRGPLP